MRPLRGGGQIKASTNPEVWRWETADTVVCAGMAELKGA
jgi:hypothetical protein